MEQNLFDTSLSFDIERIISQYEPKIKKSLYQTDVQEREELSQHIKLKLIETTQKINYESTPGFFEFQEKFQEK